MAERPQHLRVRRYGRPGRPAIVLHGGPGAPGSAGGLARALADPLHVLEPWQRWSSSVPLTVDRHVADLDDVLQSLNLLMNHPLKILQMTFPFN